MFSNKRNMNFNCFTVSTFNQRWMSGYYKIIARCNSFVDEASPAGMKTPGGRSCSIKTYILLQKVGGKYRWVCWKLPHNRNSQQEEMGRWRSRYFWERALRYCTKAVHINKQEEYFKLFKGIFQIGDEADFTNDQKQAEHLWCLGYWDLQHDLGSERVQKRTNIWPSGGEH